MSWNIRGNQSGPIGRSPIDKVHGYVDDGGLAKAICGIGYVNPMRRSDDVKRVTCRRCRKAMKI